MLKRIFAGLFLSLALAPMVFAAGVITIKSGDTLLSIARKYNTSVTSLAEINGIKNPDLIIAGNDLLVPDTNNEVEYWRNYLEKGKPLTDEIMSRIPEYVWKELTPQLIRVVKQPDGELLGGSEIVDEFICHGSECDKYVEAEEPLGYSVVSRYRTTLRSSMTATQSNIPVSTLQTFDGTTLTMSLLGERVFLVLEAGTSREEITMCTAISGTQFDPCTRGLAFSGTSTASVSANRSAHNAGTSVTMSNVHYVYEQLIDKDTSEDIGGLKAFTSSTIRIGDNTTSTNKTIQAYNGSTNLPFVRYNEATGRWQFSDDGVNTTNFTTSSAAGLAASSTRGIFIQDSLIGINASSTTGLGFDASGNLSHTVSSTTGLNYVNNVLEVNSTSLRTHIGVTTTPSANSIPLSNASSSINAGWVPSSGNSFLTTGEAINGSATPQLVSVSTTGLLYAADADDITRRKVYGFITTNAAVTTTPLVITNGLVTGFSGLTIGAQYYASTTAGAITTSPVASTTIPIGYAVSASILRVDFGTKVTQILPPLISASGNTSQTFNIGFRPEVIEMTVAMTVGASTGNQAKVYARFLGTTLVNSTRVTNDPNTQYDEFSTNSEVAVVAGSMVITISSITDTGFTINYAGSSMTTQNMSVLVSGN